MQWNWWCSVARHLEESLLSDSEIDDIHTHQKYMSVESLINCK